MNKFLDLLFKVKLLFKTFIWLDYIIRSRKIPSKFILTNNKNEIIFYHKTYGKVLTAFYKNNFGQYEFIEDRPSWI